MNKQELRDAVRGQLDVDEEELPNIRVDLYLADAFQRTIQAERKWPFLEFEWDVDFLEGEPVNVPTDLAAIEHAYLYGVDQLMFLDHGFAEEQFGRDGTLGTSRFYSIRNGKIYLWPAPFDDLSTVLLSGWRKPVDFYSVAAAAEPDCDSRLHLSLVWYGCAKAQIANEDSDLNNDYYKMWQDGVSSARDDIMRPDPGRSRIFNGGLGKLRTRFSTWTAPY